MLRLRWLVHRKVLSHPSFGSSKNDDKKTEITKSQNSRPLKTAKNRKLSFSLISKKQKV